MGERRCRALEGDDWTSGCHVVAELEGNAVACRARIDRDVGIGKDARRWEEADRYKNEMRAGLKIAKKQVALDLLLLPVSAPEAG